MSIDLCEAEPVQALDLIEQLLAVREGSAVGTLQLGDSLLENSQSIVPGGPAGLRA